MTSLIDYAGLFPPAALSMGEAVANYSKYRDGSFGWALGRFIVPATALDELENAAHASELGGEPWRLSVLAGPDLQADFARVLAFNNRQAREGEGWSALVDAVETKLDSPAAVQRATATLPAGLALYGEVSVAGSGHDVIAALADNGVRAKLRTGGTAPALFPTSEQVAHFLADCSALGVPFKMTAGLHHLLRGQYTGPDSDSIWMHGFLNVLLAATFLDSGMDPETGVQLLDETLPEAFRFEDDKVAWRDYWISTATLADTRREFALSFGSCSFTEPIEELKAGGLLEP